MAKSKKRPAKPIGSRAAKPDRFIITSARKQKRKAREARTLARRVIWYFGYGPIRPSLDADTALRDMALALLGQPHVGGDEIPDKIWKKVFRGASKDHRLFSALGEGIVLVPMATSTTGRRSPSSSRA